ncbi:hypothetical protein HMPREF9005_1182 [Actinomyces sp. oral taxon 178 str. F0338]|nr:hypothetical protein HMPREF9005_1182 [Actinomyces sp. oral taxon 178 str. F0338]
MATVEPGDRWAHPRACGENLDPVDAAARHQGSSPRVRGKRLERSRAHPQRRLIPARAGKTAGAASPPTCTRAHPRACGENDITTTDDKGQGGSSPRVRGKRADDGDEDLHGGLIPARAGKTRGSSRVNTLSWAHPRACGENTTKVRHTASPIGSSPRVRGKPSPWSTGSRTRGLIPARAGKTSALRSVTTRATAHPRACGENASAASRRRQAIGSSPRVRGKHRRRSGLRDRMGLIPARAGKTSR